MATRKNVAGKAAKEKRIVLAEPALSLEQCRSYRLKEVLSRALQVLEDPTAVMRWLNQTNRSLGGVSPLSLLDTETGYQLVLDTLGRIEYGIFS